MARLARTRLRGFAGAARATARTLALALAVCAGAAGGCRRHARARADARASARGLVVRVPGALRIARGIDTLSVGVDLESCARTRVKADSGMALGIEVTTRLFIKGATRVLSERHAVVPGSDLTALGVSWNTRRDGIPEPGKSYLAEMRFVLFETNVRPGPHWNPHSGRFKALLTRTIRQAEE